MKKGRKNMGPEKKSRVERAKVEISPSFLSDRGGRRLGIDRRRFTYTLHIPERRIGGERRRTKDRRGELNQSMIVKRRKEQERRVALLRIRDHMESGDLEMIFTEVGETEGPQRIRNSNEHEEG
ncbi:MAG: hypothetical protein PVH82_04450 [Desulfobacteraceae bacterium]|jgi:hypothetical protein